MKAFVIIFYLAVSDGRYFSKTFVWSYNFVMTSWLPLPALKHSATPRNVSMLMKIYLWKYKIFVILVLMEILQKFTSKLSCCIMMWCIYDNMMTWWFSFVTKWMAFPILIYSKQPKPISVYLKWKQWQHLLKTSLKIQKDGIYNISLKTAFFPIVFPRHFQGQRFVL